MPENTKAVPSASETVSYSRLSTYVECPAKYANKYIKKIPVTTPVEDYFLKGTLAHRCIEEVLKGTEKEDAIRTIVPDWLLNDCHLPLITPDSEEWDLGIDPDMLLSYALPVGKLMTRCMSNYKGEDAIRNNDGSVPQNIMDFPPGSYKAAYNKLALGGIRNEIDVRAVQASLPFRRFSLAKLTALAVSYVLAFKVPGWVKETVGVEYDLAAIPVVWDENTTWNGAIDWVVLNKEDKTILIDHKSEKKQATPLQVTFHSQLNIYARLYYEQTGKMPDYLGINHLPSGELIIAKVDPSVVLANYNYWETIRSKIAFDRSQDSFAKQLPTKYNSPCIRRDWKSNVITQVCPYLTTCWPEYTRYLGPELEPFLTEQALNDEGI